MTVPYIILRTLFLLFRFFINLITTKMNKNIEAGTIERVNDWNEIYQKITEYIKSKKG